VRHVRALAEHPITAPMIRYGISGVIVTTFYLGMPIVVSDGFGWPLQALIPVALVLAATLQFTLQRRFVFRHVDEFALSVHAQVVWYLIIGAIQYPTTAFGTFVLPKLFGIPDRVAFIATSLTFSLFCFLFIRRRVFHPSEPAHQQEPVIVG
jgi:putative flippase GtrA